jgi:SagB-type dehydrogenase family enzyme
MIGSLTKDIYIILRPDSVIQESERGKLSITFPPQMGSTSLQINDPGEGFLSAIRTLQNPGINHDKMGLVYQQIKTQDGLKGIGRFAALLRRLTNLGFIRYEVRSGDKPFATLIPTGKDFKLFEGSIAGAKPFVLSRFACLHREGRELLLDSPLGLGKVLTSDLQAAKLLTAFVWPHSHADIQEISPEVPASVIGGFLVLLLSIQALTAVDTNVVSEEAKSPNLETWEFHDLFFHTHSRRGRQDGQMGATYRFLGETEPLPALPAVQSAQVVALPRPDIDQLMESDLPFTKVLEGRRSIREHGKDPITAEELGEFLFRSARVRKIIQWDVDEGGISTSAETSDRVYPGGGALYELDLYLAVANCEGIQPGFYYYDPKEHTLQMLAEFSDDLRQLLMEIKWAVGADPETEYPQIAITYAARFQRVSWKYQRIAYAVILKDVGVLQATMNLVSEAMNLAGCAIGTGDSDLFSKILGEDYYYITSVGEFALGSRVNEHEQEKDNDPSARLLWSERK